MGSGDLPITHSAGLGREAATYLENLSAVGRILSSIAFLVYLGQSLVSSAIKLELEDVDVIRGFKHTIDSSLTLRLFDEGLICAQQTQDEVESVMEIVFQIMVRL